MSPVPATEGTVRARPEDEAQRDLQVLNSGVMTTGRLQRGSAESDIGRIFADANGLFSSPHGQASLATIELTPNDHDRLLELCKRFDRCLGPILILFTLDVGLLTLFGSIILTDVSCGESVLFLLSGTGQNIYRVHIQSYGPVEDLVPSQMPVSDPRSACWYELVHQSEIARSMRWLNFDITPVLEIEMELTKWNNNVRSSIDENPMSRELSDAEREQNFHKQQDRYHCAEAWRYALLLYIESVFKSDHQRCTARQNKVLRSTIDHTKCCRRTSQTQKQLLLPVFLAGSVTSDQDTREFVKDYCTYWGEKSRYSMFNSVPLLLDEVWSSGKWWGAVVDNETRTPALFTDQGATQLLLG
ncbi:hypothetical protein N7510_002734 [Penicillium lagena]|uniref:uncharacterized protein n=1 Tax=Penicillium lagena TaxID=94218 RepID=UPI0025421A94|nr:uncharacterized protein N7510_002734 [Penicillium lagena]KAJ5618750.1 hypothetical protein N7510_002734 [Penicillium lagena]